MFSIFKSSHNSRCSKQLQLVFLSLFLWACTADKTDYPLSDHYDGKTFFNPESKDPLKHSFWEVIKWRWRRFSEKGWPDKLPLENDGHFHGKERVGAGELEVTWIGHATFLVQMEGLNILTDPVWSDRTGPFGIGPKRVTPPAFPLDELPPIDLVLIGHNHYDHLDLPTLKALHQLFRPLFIAGLGNEKLLSSYGFSVKVLDWWEHILLKQTKIHFVPTVHWSTRTLWDRGETLWGGFFIQGAKKVYFSSDTAYGTHFKETAKRLGGPDLSLLPIGAYLPRWIMQRAHMNPEEAVLAHRDLKSIYSLPMHYKTFPLSDEEVDRPPKDLKVALTKYGIEESFFPVVHLGETLKY